MNKEINMKTITLFALIGTAVLGAITTKIAWLTTIILSVTNLVFLLVKDEPLVAWGFIVSSLLIAVGSLVVTLISGGAAGYLSK